MAEPNIVLILRRKRDELESLIVAYEEKLAAARCDLLHVNATLAMFEATDTVHHAAPMGLARLFKYREITKLCMAALESAARPLDTRELAVEVIRAKGRLTAQSGREPCHPCREGARKAAAHREGREAEGRLRVAPSRRNIAHVLYLRSF